MAGLPLVLALLVVWEAAVRLGVVTYDMLPAPSSIFIALVGIATSEVGISAVTHTVVVVLIGWGVAVLLGVAIGAALTESKVLWTWTMASLECLRPLPIVAFVPVALLIFGFSKTTDVVVVAYGAFWPILINAISGFRAAGKLRLEAATNLGLSPSRVFLKVTFPSALPSLLVGARLGLALGLALAIVTEMLGNPVGLGYEIMQAQHSLQPALMFAYVFIACALGVLGNWVLTRGLIAISPAVRISNNA